MTFIKSTIRLEAKAVRSALVIESYTFE